VAYTVNRMC